MFPSYLQGDKLSFSISSSYVGSLSSLCHLEKRETSSKGISGQDPYLSCINFIYNCGCVVIIFQFAGNHIS